MLIEIVQAIAVLLAPVDVIDAEALRLTASQDLTVDKAIEHLQAARVAAALADVDPDLVLAIAHHESRYTLTVTRERGGLVSCGVMTPIPRASCEHMTLLESYIDGAMHLREWYTACNGNTWCLLTGYGGGWIAVKRCQAEHSRVCSVSSAFLNRAAWIKSLRTNKRKSS